MKKSLFIIGLALALVCASYAATMALSVYGDDNTDERGTNGYLSGGPDQVVNAADQGGSLPEESEIYGPPSGGGSYMTGSLDPMVSASTINTGNSEGATESNTGCIDGCNGEYSNTVTASDGNATAESSISISLNGDCDSNSGDGRTSTGSITVNSTSSVTVSPSTSSGSPSTAISDALPALPPIADLPSTGSNTRPQIDQNIIQQTTSAVQEILKDVDVVFIPDEGYSRSKNLLRVVVFSNPNFNATTVNPDTILLAGASPCNVRKSRVDINFDGLPDLFVYFDKSDFKSQTGTGEVFLTGKTPNGEGFKSRKGTHI